MTRVLVTGSSGTVGRWCVEALERRGLEVVPVRRSGEDGVDLLDRDQVDRLVARVRADALVHLAWETGHGRFWTAPENDAWLEASTHLVDSFARRGGRRLVVAGTCAEYSWSPEDLADGTCREARTPLLPATPYGLAKAELHRRLSSPGPWDELELAWGRIFSTYGPGEAPGRLVPAVATALLRGEPADVSSGRQVRDYLHAGEVGAAFASLCDSSVTGAVNVASGEGVRIADLVALVAEIVGRPDLLRLGALPDRAEEPERLVADVTRLHDEVGWTAATTLPEGIAQTVEHLRASA